jgi:hypothetical protein
MKKFRARTWADRIESIEVVSETAKTVTTTSGRRTAKESSGEFICDSWDEAHKYLMEVAQREVEVARLRLQYANDKLGNVKGMKKPVDA